VALKAVQELLGHATIDMTMRYAHLSPEVKRDAVRVLDRPALSPAPRGRGRTAHEPVEDQVEDYVHVHVDDHVHDHDHDHVAVPYAARGAWVAEKKKPPAEAGG
jgi:hypothetical protein